MPRAPYVLAFAVVLAEGCAGPVSRVPAASAGNGAEAIARAATASTQVKPAAIAPPVATASLVEDAPVRWTDLYRAYLGPGTIGGCAQARPCHVDTMGDAGSAYAWLAQRGYIAGTESALVMKNSCLRWFGGNMPPRGGPNDAAAREIEAWVAAGAQEN